jgi:hypothetical protein
VEFSSHRCFYKLSRSWLLGVCHSFCLLWAACLFTVPWGIAPLPLFVTQGTPSSLLHVFLLLLLLFIQFFFSFFPRWRSVCPGGYGDLAQGCLLEYHVPLSSPFLCLPKPSGCWHLVAQEPSWFLHLMWSEDAMCRLEVWRGQSFASSWWLFL